MKTNLALAIAAILSLTACSKKSGNGPTGTGGGGTVSTGGNTDRVKTITIVVQVSGKNDTTLQQFSYDAQDRPSQQILGTDTTNYTYASNLLVATEGIWETEYFLNGSGSADSAYQAAALSGPAITTPLAPGTAIFRYRHDGNGYLSSYTLSQETSAGFDTLVDTETFTVSNGNITQEEDGSTQAISSFTYTQQTTTTLPLPPDIGGPELFAGPTPPGNLLGKANAGLLVSYPMVENTLNTVVTVTYTLDSQGRIVSVKQDTPIGLSAPAMEYYTYY